MLFNQAKDRFGNKSRWIAGISLLAVVGAVCIFARPAKSHFTAPPARTAEKGSPLNARLSTQPASPAEQARITSSFGNLPLSFEPNLGQTDPQVKFTARGNGYQLFLTPAKAVMSLASPRKTDPRSDADHGTTPSEVRSSVVQMEFVGAQGQPEISPSVLLPGVSNYFIGDDPHRWATGVPHYAQVNYRDVYPGVSLHFSGEGPEVGLGFVVAAGIDPSLVHLRFNGATRVNTDADGGLAVAAETGILHFRTLHAYQEIQGKLQSVDANFEVQQDAGVVLALGTYDHSRELVIDAYSTNTARAQSSAAPTNHSWLLSLAWVPILGIALAGVGAVQRKRLFASLLLCLSLAGLAVMVACGNGQGG
ncbi:MAG TPA: hypothetical protein VLL05_22730, partial [Terriglobales bacterium]|nr:hypothetical protein [Terriglobales bacterium]